MDGVVIRAAGPADLPQVAALRWDGSVGELGEAPAGGRDEFVADFVRWAATQRDSHRCWVADSGGRVVGMAWLAVQERPPSPSSPRRRSADLQTVYVEPAFRNAGIAGRLVAEVVRTAAGLGAGRITVHSSRRAVPVYRRAGFAQSPVLLQQVLDG